MAGTPPKWASDMLATWFDELGPSDWFHGGDEVDRLLSERFAATLDEQALQPADSFLDDARTARAAILLFDQLPRNLHRDTARAFAYDPLALAIAKEVIARRWDAGLSNDERQFVAMPLMHSEELTDQQACVAYFERHLPGGLSFARSHHEMIERFGRFPHRNDVLGRETSEAEQAALDEGFSW